MHVLLGNKLSKGLMYEEFHFYKTIVGIACMYDQSEYALKMQKYSIYNNLIRKRTPYGRRAWKLILDTDAPSVH